MVGKDTHTRQRQLRAKIVNASHGKLYIKDPLLCTEGGNERGGKITVIGIYRKNHNPVVSIEKEMK